MTDANRRYHDRVAARYDAIYERDAYWDYYFEVSWQDLKSSLPRDQGPEVLDVGCGTGRYGLKLLKSGYRVVFSDLSPRMVDRALEAAAEEYAPDRFRGAAADITDLAPFEDRSFSFLTGQGDPLSFASDWRRALKAIHRVLRPGGRAVLSVDNRYGAIDVFERRRELDELEKFLEDGQGEWLAKKAEERFAFHAFTPKELRRGAERAGLVFIGLIGKTIFDLRGGHPWLEDREARRRLLGLELRHGGSELALGRAHHLQLTLARPEEDAEGNPIVPDGARTAHDGAPPARRRGRGRKRR